MNRIYEDIIYNNLLNYPQMVFLVGPRQVGKTTIAKKLQARFSQSLYLNFDSVKDRQKILDGQSFIENIFPTNTLRETKPLVIFDEIHKYKDWKNYIKGFYDLYRDYYSIIVTGSARLDVYQSGGDSLMGRYFQYNIHPLSVSELIAAKREKINNYYFTPFELESDVFNSLYKYGGFPDPFYNKNDQFFNMWQATRFKQLIHEEIMSIANLQEVYLLELLAEILKSQAGMLLNRSSIGKKIGVTSQTVSRWLNILDRFYYCFTIRPWFKNVTRSLIKDPKVYLWDWSLVVDEGARVENFIASHLLKFVNFYSDIGYGRLELYYLRDIDKKEADFLIVKDNKPFIIIEAKTSDIKLSSAIAHFKAQLSPDFSFQVVFNEKYIHKSCFDFKSIMIIPAATFLSQLV